MEAVAISSCKSNFIVTDSSSSSAAQKVQVEERSILYVVSGSRDRSIRLWEPLVTDACLCVFEGHDSWVRSLSLQFQAKQWWVVSAGDDKAIRVFSVKEQRCVRTIADAHGHFITSLAFSGKGNVLVTGSVDKNLGIWSCGN